jgi:hypothetical protein
LTDIPPAAEYATSWDLARDLNEHGLGCTYPTRTRLMTLGYRYLAIWVPRRLLPDTLVCSVGGRPVFLHVLHPVSVKVLIDPQPTPRYTNLQDAVAHWVDSVMEDLGVDAMLVGPNWMVMARQEGDSIPTLFAIRPEIGGALVVAASSTPTASPST